MHFTKNIEIKLTKISENISEFNVNFKKLIKDKKIKDDVNGKQIKENQNIYAVNYRNKSLWNVRK